MKGSTHALAGILLGLLFFHPLFPLALVILGSLFPDVDKMGSLFSKNIPFGKYISGVVESSFTHRGFFHALWIPFLLLATTYSPLATSYLPPSTLYFPFVIGYVSHLFLDALTISGIRPFFPFNILRIHGAIKTGGWWENVVVVGMGAVFLFVLLNILS